VADSAAPEGAGDVLDDLSAHAQGAYRSLVWDDPSFPAFFRHFTPVDELALLEIGSRPASRPEAAQQGELQALRAIPWVFAWTQSRINLPAWFGVGSALAAYAKAHRGGRRHLADAYRSWEFFSSMIDNVELGVAIADPSLAERYAALAGGDPSMHRIADTIESERRLTVSELASLTGRDRLLESSPRLRRSIELRTPYVDVLSELQLHALELLRGGELSSDERGAANDLLQLSISGVAAGLQHTG
jgi:phosphoenolpyruvate carboxylase